MPIEKQVVALPSGLKVHVERHVFDPAFETVILVNGALATTASFGQTIRYLGERVSLPDRNTAIQPSVADTSGNSAPVDATPIPSV